MTGTQNQEGIAGVTAAIDYLASIAPDVQRHESRRQRLLRAFRAIEEHERSLAERLLDGLRSRPRFRVWGITQRDRLSERVPTVSITAADRTPLQIAEHLARREIYTWSGNMYALELTERLEVEEHGGLLRLGVVHYNLSEEIHRLLQALDEI